ncbi:thioredoxin-dependent thiol peroxidase [Pullulanibacillus sp. KACC 23026]|uniref:thioredoxin-dependent thiol peroxidase n=1 Tax=Pullulanibacillus sp. KACC 23026 TaxID=3028315 RepID=UPI0023AF36F7|nr:thioredoxin-dependent thiol peroxidase [Pullulanibacillus sp. KACC 23026]WEG12265.1 thioredoxin-dependent thiol peroxidase [Pullulanibacillus sp. KACC 23026]
MLEAGQKAPDFSLQATNGDMLTMDEFKGKNVVLYFYPKDMTPGCTTEACDFRDHHAGFAEINTVVLGVSADPVSDHEKFTEKHALPFPLLADVDHKLCEAYGVWQEKTNFGKKYMGIVRATFVIDKEGVIRKVWPKVKVEGHVQEVYNYIKENLEG